MARKEGIFGKNMEIKWSKIEIITSFSYSLLTRSIIRAADTTSGAQRSQVCGKCDKKGRNVHCKKPRKLIEQMLSRENK